MIASTTIPTTTITIPLISTFTPPAGCLGFTYNVSGSTGDHWVGDYTIDRGIRPSCFPSSYSTVMFDYGPQFRTELKTPGTEDLYTAMTAYLPYYSPGVCPSGYATVQQNTSDSVTFATCCPTFASFTWNDEWLNCALSPMPSPYTVFGLGEREPSHPPITLTGASAREEAITVAWQISDLSLWGRATPAQQLATPTSRSLTPTSQLVTPTYSLPSIALNSASASNSSAAIATPTSSLRSSEKESPTSGISVAAAAGLGIGGTVTSAFLFLLIAYFWRRRKQAAVNANQRGVLDITTDDSRRGQWKSELVEDEREVYRRDGDSDSNSEMATDDVVISRKYGTEGFASHEMYSGCKPLESAPRTSFPVELASDRRRRKGPPVPAKPRDSNMF